MDREWCSTMVDVRDVESIAREAGEMLLKAFADTASLRIERKADGVNNLVTDMDHQSERLIRNRLADLDSIRFMGEESATEIDYGGLVWVVDPIDGTVNFAHGLPIWTVSIALVEDGIPLLGVIYDPNTDEIYSAVAGAGATCNGHPLKVSRVEQLDRSFLVTGFPYDVDQNPHGTIDTFARVLQHGIAVRRLGSAALDLALVAAGVFDAFWEVSLNPWDVAAGILLVREAGGRVTSYESTQGEDSGRIITDRLLASNGLIDPELREILLPTTEA